MASGDGFHAEYFDVSSAHSFGPCSNNLPLITIYSGLDPETQVDMLYHRNRILCSWRAAIAFAAECPPKYLGVGAGTYSGSLMRIMNFFFHQENLLQ